MHTCNGRPNRTQSLSPGTFGVAHQAGWVGRSQASSGGRPGLETHSPFYGIISTWPTKIRLGLTRLLSEMIAQGVTRYMAAMAHTVSPGPTT
jgi:hypothetical protein